MTASTKQVRISPWSHLATVNREEGLEDRPSFGLPQGDSELHAPHLSMVSPPTFHRSTSNAAANSSRPASRGQQAQDGRVEMVEAGFCPPLEDVGIPRDGVWDHDAAYKSRFCYDHGQMEYLLGTADRWMAPGDFRVPEAVLEARFHRHRKSPAKFRPHARRCQAECRGSLFSHIYSVIDRRGGGDGTLYRVQWKACWTPESNIVDKDWIASSLEINKNSLWRHSTRLENSVEERKKSYEKMMVVVNLE